MENKKIIVAMLLSITSYIAYSDQSGSVQSGVVISTKALASGIVLTGGALWYLKNRSDRLEAKLKKRNQDLLQEESDRQMGVLRSAFYSIGDLTSWLFGFSSGYTTTVKIFGRSLFGLTQSSKGEKEESGLKEAIDHAYFTKFSSQISSGYFSSSEYDPNVKIDNDPAVHRVFEKFESDCKTRLQWMSCLAQNKSVNWNAADRKGRTLLHRAVHAGDAELVRFLKQHGAKSEAGIAQNGDADGVTALHLVSEVEDHNKRMQIAGDLLQSPQVDIEVRFVNGGRTPLGAAASLGRSDLVRLYLEKNASTQVRDDHGDTPLFIAVKTGNRASVIELLRHDNGCTVNTKNRQGDTPLCWAIRNKKYDVTRTLLVDKHIDIQLPDIGEKTPVQLLCDNADDESLAIIVRLDVAEFQNAKCLFDRAIQNKKYSVARFLFGSVLTDEEREEVKTTTLIESVRSGDIESVRCLVAIEGVRLDHIHGDNTILHEAAMTGNNRLFMLVRHAMRERGIDIARENADGETAQQVLDSIQLWESRATKQAKPWWQKIV